MAVRLALNFHAACPPADSIASPTWCRVRAGNRTSAPLPQLPAVKMFTAVCRGLEWTVRSVAAAPTIARPTTTEARSLRDPFGVEPADAKAMDPAARGED